MSVEPEALATACARLAEKIKGEDILVLHVEPLSSLTLYFVIASARNARQLKAMANEVEAGAKALGGRCLGTEGTPQCGWILVDLGDVIVHLFNRATRAVYDLELLWGDAARVEWKEDESGDQPRQKGQ